ncbi:esterase/lipase family protein [Luteitalea sp.]
MRRGSTGRSRTREDVVTGARSRTVAGALVVGAWLGTLAAPVAAQSTAPRTSPFTPPATSDALFVVDGGSGLDTGCSYRSDGPLEIVVAVTRWVGPVDADGRLINPSALITSGVVSPSATLILPAFDVDVAPTNGRPPEVNRVSLNGKVLGNLVGANNTWQLNQFVVDIGDLRFPDRAALGSTPAPALNRLRIDIDTASGADENWCTAIDWAAVSFKAMSPIILTHGNNSSGAFWDRHGFSAALAAARLPFDGCADPTRCRNPLNLPTDAIAANGARLGQLIPDIVRTFGADSYHIVAHSKGGLDTREYLANHAPPDLTLLSHNTVSTPHNGSVMADLSVARGVSLNVLVQTQFIGFPTFLPSLLDLANLTGPDAGALNLTTTHVAGFNASNVAALPSADYNQVVADADRNASASVDTEAEVAALRLDDGSLAPMPTIVATNAIDPLYRTLRNTRAITTTLGVGLLGGALPIPVPMLTITAVPGTTPLGNDVLVTLPSGLGQGSIAARSTGTRIFQGASGRNHSDVADGGVAAAVIPWLLSAERARGDLR